jgi:hypothetical protein
VQQNCNYGLHRCISQEQRKTAAVATAGRF